ncbi:MAG TPA: hypothetical protein DCE44_05685 [Verrucomicrobiales bacterium]|nr:hypothetical protein [Verrucomicrobiales bacterium]
MTHGLRHLPRLEVGKVLDSSIQSSLTGGKLPKGSGRNSAGAFSKPISQCSGIECIQRELEFFIAPRQPAPTPAEVWRRFVRPKGARSGEVCPSRQLADLERSQFGFRTRTVVPVSKVEALGLRGNKHFDKWRRADELLLKRDQRGAEKLRHPASGR